MTTLDNNVEDDRDEIEEDIDEDPPEDDGGCQCEECCDTSCGEEVMYRYTSFIRKLEAAGFVECGEGSFRRVFKRGKVVIKVPKYTDSILDNQMEAHAYSKYKNGPTDLGIYLAPCRLLPNDCLMMMAIEEDLRYDSRRPSWADMIDNTQVGTYKGRVVSYDYALDLTERLQWEEDMGECSNFFQNSYIARYYNEHLRKRNVA